ncbi:hypothetical protein FO519_002336 [Halicephalobus sp. NKZ332]|nr:hypothetical protein FO519_002336 [Halicephalobus sp. NKZ332]
MLVHIKFKEIFVRRDPIHVWIFSIFAVFSVFGFCKLINYGERVIEVPKTRAAELQPREGSLFCFVLTDEKFHKTRIPALAQTWLPSCDAYHIYSNSVKDLPDLPVHELFKNLPESYWRLFWKSRLALHYSFANVSSNFDWYLKSDDDAYFFVEKLKDYLRKFDPNKPHLFGFRLRRRFPKGYVNGGGGYILSREAIKQFASKAFNDSEICPFYEWEDLGISRCLSNLGISPEDTRTFNNKQRFLAFLPDEHFYGTIPNEWMFDKLEFSGFDIYHKELISFHHLKPQEIRLIHGLTTRLNRD